MKNHKTSFLLLLFVAFIEFGFSQTTINLNNTDAGTKNYQANESVTFSNGYHFIGNSSNQQMSAKINQALIGGASYSGLLSTTTFNNKSINTNLPVRAVAGAPSVSPTGAANYTIPITIQRYWWNGALSFCSL